jgi:hypothetical protein
MGRFIGNIGIAFLAFIAGLMCTLIVTKGASLEQLVGVPYKTLTEQRDSCDLAIARNKSCKAVITWEVVDNAK